jgi:hypothetical protein
MYIPFVLDLKSRAFPNKGIPGGPGIFLKNLLTLYCFKKAYHQQKTTITTNAEKNSNITFIVGWTTSAPLKCSLQLYGLL